MKQTRLIAQLEQARDLIAKPGTWVQRHRKVKKSANSTSGKVGWRATIRLLCSWRTR